MVILGRSENRPIHRQEYHPLTRLPDPGLYAASRVNKVSESENKLVQEQE